SRSEAASRPPGSRGNRPGKSGAGRRSTREAIPPPDGALAQHSREWCAATLSEASGVLLVGACCWAPVWDGSHCMCWPQMKYMRMARISRPRTMATVSEADQGKTARSPVLDGDDPREVAR